MEGATFAAATAAADNIGIIAVLLLIFAGYFVWRAKEDVKRQDAEKKKHQEDLENLNKRLSEREDMLIAQSREREETLISRNKEREEMLRSDADRREKLLREESAKRESILMVNMERIANSIDNITKTLGKMESRLDRIDRKLEKGEENAGK